MALTMVGVFRPVFSNLELLISHIKGVCLLKSGLSALVDFSSSCGCSAPKKITRLLFKHLNDNLDG